MLFDCLNSLVYLLPKFMKYIYFCPCPPMMMVSSFVIVTLLAIPKVAFKAYGSSEILSK